MSILERPAQQDEIVYPESDGEPMSDNTLQWQWIVTIKGGLEALFRHDPDVFVAGNFLWYPVEGRPDIRLGPDTMVVFGRPKGHRGSYQQWKENGIPPQVVFEVLSPGNTIPEMVRKHQFYQRYGVEEYYLYDPDHNDLSGWLREGEELREVPEMDGWVSPRLGVRFDLSGPELRILRPDGAPLLYYVDLAEQQERDRERAEQERERAERLEAQLRALGVEPEA